MVSLEIAWTGITNEEPDIPQYPLTISLFSSIGVMMVSQNLTNLVH